MILLGATLMGGVLFAQPRVIGVHPAHDGKLLTMEESVVGRTVYPENRYYTWVNDNEYRFYTGQGWENGKIEEFDYPSDMSSSAYTEGNSLYIKDYMGNVTPVAVSNDREIVYGQSVSRNEFGIEGGIFWSPTRRKLAFFRKDESRVTDFPLLNIRTRTGELELLKYPMNGMDSEIVSVGHPALPHLLRSGFRYGNDRHRTHYG